MKSLPPYSVCVVRIRQRLVTMVGAFVQYNRAFLPRWETGRHQRVRCRGGLKAQKGDTRTPWCDKSTLDFTMVDLW
eukprot:m.382621 g.382621  ORF g.382621 m.382621 type:complete len:76 (-) comp20974_c0_seq6:349-576(-)